MKGKEKITCTMNKQIELKESVLLNQCSSSLLNLGNQEWFELEGALNLIPFQALPLYPVSLGMQDKIYSQHFPQPPREAHPITSCLTEFQEVP